MPLMQGLFEPSAAVITTAGITADTTGGLDASSTATAPTRVLRARAGRRLLGYTWRSTSVAIPIRNAARLVRGDVVNAATQGFGAFESSTGANETQWFGPAGIDVSDGISVDWVAGSIADLSLYYIDVS